MRAILISSVAGIITAGAIALIGPAEAAQRDFVRNQWGGVVRCADLGRNPYATARMVAWCSGASIRSADPARFDCRTAEVDAELAYCGKR